MQFYQMDLIQQSWNQVMPNRTGFAGIFYTRLFQLHPDFRYLFKGSSVEQENHLLIAIGSCIAGSKHLYEIVPYLRGLGERHAGYGVKKEDFEPFINTFLETMKASLGSEYTADINSAWSAAFLTIVEVMIQGIDGCSTEVIPLCNFR